MKYQLTYEDIIQSVSEIVENEKITLDGLTLMYKIPERNHLKLDEELYYRYNPEGKDFKHRDIIEIEIADINVVIVVDDE